MHARKEDFSYTIYAGKDELQPGDQSLVAGAVDACRLAYAPYSKYKVGVAILTVDQQIVTGSNQENGSFPAGQCAERVALYMLSHTVGRTPIDTIAIAVDSPLQASPASPCGSCRQLLVEYSSFQDTPIRLLLALADGGEVYEIADVRHLLPLAFSGRFLGG